jgi:chromosome segregation ATPase
MDWLETQIRDQITGRVATKPSERVVNFPGAPSGAPSDNATAALDLVSEVAEAIKSAEDRAAETMARAQSLASSSVEKLRLAEARIARAEAAQRQAEADLETFRAELEKTRNELEQTQAQFAAKSDELAAAERRASVAQSRASDAEAALERVVMALRSQLPRKDGSAAKASATA